jgi:hypothetical protein
MPPDNLGQTILFRQTGELFVVCEPEVGVPQQAVDRLRGRVSERFPLKRILIRTSAVIFGVGDAY